MSPNTPKPAPQATLSLSFEEVGRLRVRPAEFARMVGVSRQSVSEWIRDGKVRLGADGRLDPQVAAREVVARSDPARLRARVLRAAVEDSGTLRRRIADLEAALAAARARVAFLERFSELQDVAEGILVARILGGLDELAAADPAARCAIVDDWRDDATIAADETEAEGGGAPADELDDWLAREVADLGDLPLVALPGEGAE